ncbi:glycoside hydrolase family protein [Pelosinus propionicus]|nr:hypothetical protein [Pelosinus propionicus]
MFEYAQAPCVLKFADFIRVYFSCRPTRDCNGQCVSYSAYVDLDRKDLFKIVNLAQKPILELGERGCFDEFGIYPISVIRDGDDVRAYYTGHTRCESVPFDTAIGLAISKDYGQIFERVGRGPVLSSSLDEPFVLSGPKIRKFNEMYYLFYITGKKWIEANGRKEVVYKIRMAISKDGISWNKLNKNIIEEKWGDHEVQASPDVFFNNGKYHMFFCYMLTPDFRYDKQKSYRIGYASSVDLINWERDDSKAGIDVSQAGFDNEMIAYPHVFELDGKIYMLYLGNEVGRYGFALAELRGELD